LKKVKVQIINVAFAKSLEWISTENDPNIVTYTYEKDAKGRVVKQTRVGMSWNEGKQMKSTRVAYFDYMSK
jgi:hypothetical protein